MAGLAVTLDAQPRARRTVRRLHRQLPWRRGRSRRLARRVPHYLSRAGASLLDPAPALNAITVGSIARNERNERWPNDPGYSPGCQDRAAIPVHAPCPSVNGAIKPDLVDYGGNAAVDVRAGNRLTPGRQGVGELSISRDFAEGRLFAEDSGTSFAAPRVANAAARILAEHPDASTDLCRALLVAHARTPGACADLFAADADALRNVTGYGQVDRSALCQSLEDCVTLWAAEAIENRRHHFYEIRYRTISGKATAHAGSDRRPCVSTGGADHTDRLPGRFRQLQAHPGRVTRSGRALVQRPSGQSRRRERARACRRSPVLGDCALSGNGSGIPRGRSRDLPSPCGSVLVRRGDAQRSDLGSRSLARPGAICARRGSQRPRGSNSSGSMQPSCTHRSKRAFARGPESGRGGEKAPPVAGRSGQAACPTWVYDSARGVLREPRGGGHSGCDQGSRPPSPPTWRRGD